MINDFNIHMVKEKFSMEFSVGECGHQKCPPNHSFGPHPRDHYIIHYVVSGSGMLKNEFGEFKVTSGQGFLITPNEPTTVYTADSVHPWDYMWLGFNGTQVKNMLQECNLSRSSPIFCHEVGGSVHENFLKINQLDKSKSGYIRAIIGYAQLIFAALTADHVEELSQGERTLKLAIEYIYSKIADDLSVADICSQLFIERTTLFRLFKKWLNLSPIQYIMECRLNRAKDMLTHSALTITQIAMHSGFASVSIFCKQFKEKFSHTPKQYRDRFR